MPSQVKKRIVLVGGGGHCKSCIDVIRAADQFEIAGIVENPDHVPDQDFRVNGIPVIGSDLDLPKMVDEFRFFLITVGQIKSAQIRIKLFETIQSLGGVFPVIISPSAQVSPSARLGDGTIVMHHSVITTEAVVGQNCILNTGTLVEHESKIGDHIHISTKAIVNGQCQVGSRTLIGSNTVLANNVTIPDDTLIAAGSVVLKSLERPGTYIGNPLRKIR